MDNNDEKMTILFEEISKQGLTELFDEKRSSLKGSVWLVVFVNADTARLKWHTTFWCWDPRKGKIIGDVSCFQGEMADIYHHPIEKKIFYREFGSLPTCFNYTGKLLSEG